ncbi:MAG: AMP-binding protein [Acidimicrobiales bacterium]
MNLASLVNSHPGSRRALSDAAGWIDWSEVRRRAQAVSTALAGKGIGPGDRVALSLPTSIEFVVGYLGALAAGAVVAPLNPSSPSSEKEPQTAFIEPSLTITAGYVAEAVAAASAEASSGAGADSLAIVERSDDDPAVMLFTSGTSASAHVAVLSHGNLTSNLRQMLAVPGTLLAAEDVGLAAVPFFHVFGLNVVLGLTLATGAGLVCEERFDPAEALGFVETSGVTVVAGAPPMFADWVDLTSSDGTAFANVRLLVSGASALGVETAERFKAKFGLPIHEGYGLTEASPVVSTSVGLEFPTPGSVGRPLPGIDMRLVDESGEDALFDDPGEIWVRGPNVFSGYWRDEEATARVLDSDEWLHTGDVGVLDDAGELHVVDRLKDIIIVSGFNVIPAEVERVVRAIDGVNDVVVIGRDAPRTGETVEAVVVADPGSHLTESDVIEAARAHLAHYKVPETVRFVGSLPHGLAGKALRRGAREAAN